MIDEETIEIILRALNEWESDNHNRLSECGVDSKSYKKGYRQGYNDALEDFTDYLNELCY